MNNQKNNAIDLNKGQKITIVALLSIIVIMLGLLLFLPSIGDTNTIMIYVVGSNLETDLGIVTADLNSINPQRIDLDKTHVLLYTGGTEKWHNFISNEDNGLYVLEKDGFKKLESQPQYNFGEPNTLTNFLKYGYENYKASKYNLVLYDHGGAIDGAIYDTFTDDHLTLSDMSKALKNSPFNENNKLESVLFRTCLNGTIELANIFSPYANYLIGSEEVSWGSPYTSVLNFINELTQQDNGKEYGIKFVEAYEQQMQKLFTISNQTYTYSVIDLSKIDKVNILLDEYISSINLTQNYSNISKIRSNLYQYGYEEPSYDMIDLYEFVNSTKEYANVDGQKLMKAIDECVVYNNSNNNLSHGLSIYFPYNGRKSIKNMFLKEVYENLKYSTAYKEFINNYNAIQSSPSSYSFNIDNNEVKKDDTTKKVSLKLTDEQLENYTSATFGIFQRDAEHPNYYRLLLNSDNVTLSKKGLLTANYENSLIKYYDAEDSQDKYVPTMYRKNYNDSRSATMFLYNTNKKVDDMGYFSLVTMYIVTDKEVNPAISNVKLKSKNEYVDGAILNIDEYNKFEIWYSDYRILDESGNVLDTSEWETAPVKEGYNGEISAIKTGLKYSDLDKGDNYYVVFFIHDINNEIISSKPIKVGE